jgi:LCP family protein required for cell wall assembly
VLLLVIIAVGGYYGYSFYTFAKDIQRPNIVKDPDTGKKPNKEQIPLWGGKERVNILMMGVDSRDRDEVPRSDSMLLVSIDPVGKTYDIFSILRDTYVNIPGYGESRINAALGHGGPSLAMETVSQFTGIPVSYYVITDFEGFKSLIDAVGGVDIDVEKNMYYRDPGDKGKYDINLKKGLQHLDGDKALQYVRFRHDATSDYTRTERQRKLLTALADQLQSGMSVIQLPKILEKVSPYVQTNLTSMDMIKLAGLCLTLHKTESAGYQLPQPNAFQEVNRGGSVLLPSIPDVQAFVQEKLQHQPADPS